MREFSSVFVAGAATLVGRAVIRRLESIGIQTIFGLDDQPDFTDSAAVDRFFTRTRPDAVIVTAGAAAGIGGNLARPADLMRDNLLVAAHVIPGAWRAGVKRLVYVASSCAYPKDAPQPLAVESLWTGRLEPTSAAYAVAKLAGLGLCDAYRRQYGVSFVTAIKADAFGPGDDFSPANAHVVGALIRRVHEAKSSGAASVEVWGSGMPRREFIYVDDLADALVFTLHHYDGDAPINIGTGVTTSICELAETIRVVTGYGGELRFDTSRPDGMLFKGLDSAPLAALGWRPSWDFMSALRATYDWFVEHCDEASAELTT
jgi:GDP-L-fucose synthase